MDSENYIDVSDPEAVARHRLSGWWDLLGEPASYPCTTQTVCRLLAAVEYRSDADIVLQATNEKWIPPVEKSGGRLQWSASAVVSLAAAFEARRLWIRRSRIHAHKLTLAEQLRELAYDESEHGQYVFEDISKFDWPAMIGMLVTVAHDAGAVQTMAEAIRMKLVQEGVL